MSSENTKVVLVFSNGETLVASPSGDQYWITDQQGQATPCSLQHACRCWQQYEQSLQNGPQVTGGPDPGTCPTAPSTTPTAVSWDEYSPWQRDLLTKLGLTPEDVDPLATKKAG